MLTDVLSTIIIVIEDNKGKLIFFKLSTNKPIKPFIEINKPTKKKGKK